MNTLSSTTVSRATPGSSVRSSVEGLAAPRAAASTVLASGRRSTRRRSTSWPSRRTRPAAPGDCLPDRCHFGQPDGRLSSLGDHGGRPPRRRPGVRRSPRLSSGRVPSDGAADELHVGVLKGLLDPREVDAVGRHTVRGRRRPGSPGRSRLSPGPAPRRRAARAAEPPRSRPVRFRSTRSAGVGRGRSSLPRATTRMGRSDGSIRRTRGDRSARAGRRRHGRASGVPRVRRSRGRCSSRSRAAPGCRRAGSGWSRPSRPSTAATACSTGTVTPRSTCSGGTRARAVQTTSAG